MCRNSLGTCPAVGWMVLLAGVLLLPVATAAGAELVVANHGILQKVYPDTYKPPAGALKPIELTGVRAGTFAGQVVVSSAELIKNLAAEPTDLTGPGRIPAQCVRIRYGLPDGAPPKRGQMGPFDSLEDSAPAEVPVYRSGRAVQPLWLTVTVPADAKAGRYSGAVRIRADGAGTVDVPLTLEVIDWTLPDPNDFTSHMDFVESPESVALAYGVPMWSEQHLKLLDKVFALLRPLAAKTIYISAIRRTHFGNEHAMVRWYRDSDGELQPNFEHVEKYLQVATRHLGKVPGVILLCWEPLSSMGHAGGTGSARRTCDKPILYTLWNPKTGKLRKRTGPAWGTPEARKFWRKFTDGIQPVLKKFGLEKSMIFGLIGDSRPTKIAMDDITSGVPNAKWAVHSHHYCNRWQGYEIGMCCALWGIHLNIVDPEKGHGYGWQNPFWLAYYPREFSLHSSLVEHRYKLEMWLGAFSLFEMKHKGKSRTARGLGRIGADFWKVVKDRRGRLVATLAGIYPESYWGQLNLNYCIPHILGKGKTGPLATVRSEAFREGIQEAEARVFIEKAIVLKDRRAKVGEELAKRCRAMLDDRIRMVNRAGQPRKDQTGIKPLKGLPANWRQSGEKLFRMAAEVAARLGA